jgi:hypothetical protein
MFKLPLIIFNLVPDDCKVLYLNRAVYTIQILNFVWWHVVYLSPQYETCAVSPFWHLEI